MKLRNKIFSFLTIGLGVSTAAIPVLTMSSCSTDWKSINQKEIDSIKFIVDYTYEPRGEYKQNNKKLEDYKGIIDYTINFNLKKWYDADQLIDRVPNNIKVIGIPIDPEHKTNDNDVRADFFSFKYQLNMNMDYYGTNNAPVKHTLYYDENCFDTKGNYIGGSIPLYNSWNYQFNFPYGNKIIRFDKYKVIDENKDGKYDQLLINELSLTSGEWIRNTFYENPLTKAIRKDVVVYTFKQDAWTKQPGWASGDGWPLDKQEA